MHLKRRETDISYHGPKIPRHVLLAGGVPTEVFHIHHQHSQVQCVIVPGNPGSALYYLHLMQFLDERFQGQADVLSLSHAGHCPHIRNDEQKLWTLEDQIDHFCSFLEEHVLRPSAPPVIILGHSIGAYMSVKAAHRIEQAQLCSPRILKVWCLFPFFETDFRLPSQRHLRLVSRFYNVVGMFARLLSNAPLHVQEWFIRKSAKDNLNTHAVVTTRILFDGQSIRNNFFLAHHEFNDLSRPFDWKLLEYLGPRVHVLGCPKDTWLSRNQYEEMLARVPSLQATWHEEFTHAFCVNVTMCHDLAALVHAHTSEAMAAAAAAGTSQGGALHGAGSGTGAKAPRSGRRSRPTSPLPARGRRASASCPGGAALLDLTGSTQLHTYNTRYRKAREAAAAGTAAAM